MTASHDSIRCYSVVVLLPSNATIAVAIDGNEQQLYPLKSSTHAHTTLVYAGEAPQAVKYYNYTILVDGNITQRETCRRSLSDSATPSAYDFFNHVPSTRRVAQLPQLYDHLFDHTPTALHKDGEIATLHFTGNPDDFDLIHRRYQEKIKINVAMSYISADDLVEFDSVELKLSGRASRWMEKLSYGIKLPKESRLYGHRHLKLRALASDPSYLREFLAYKCIKALGLPCSDFSFVRVFINDQPIGLFGLIEVYKKPWIKNTFGDRKVGIMYQGLGYSAESARHSRCADLRYDTDLRSYQYDQYRIKVAGKKDNGYEALQALTKTIVDGTWADHVNVESYLRSIAFEIVGGLADSLVTMADNYFVYKHKDRFVHIMSDLDMSFGQTIMSLEDMLSDDYRRYPGLTVRPVSKFILDDPALDTQLQQTIHDLASRLMHPDIMRPVIDDTYTLIEQDVAWDKQLPRMGQNYLKRHIASNQNNELPFWVHPPINPKVLEDYQIRMRNDDVGFHDAVYGKPGYVSLTGVMEYITKSSKAHSRT